MADESKQNNLNKNLKRLSEIAEWFDSREEVDVEEGLIKVKEAVILIKASKQRLKEIENEFKYIQKDMDVDSDGAENDGDKQAGDTPF